MADNKKIKDMKRGKREVPYSLIILFLSLSFIIIFAGYIYYRNYKKTLTENIQKELISICDLKVNQLVQWRKERIEDARYILNNVLISDEINAFLKGPVHYAYKDKIFLWLTQTKDSFDYKEVAVFDLNGRIIFSTEKDIHQDESHMRLSKTSLEKKEIVFGDIHKHQTTGEIDISIFIPVFSSNGRGKDTVGGIMLLIDPGKFLYPLIQSWPVPSETAETLLLRQDGKDILYLNELRHKKKTALSFRIPIANESLTASMAVRGKEGIVEGRDYRDIPVIAALRKVPDTNWYFIAKMDLKEVYVPVSATALNIFIFMVLGVLSSGLGIGLFWRNQMTTYYLGLYRAEEARQDILKLNEDRLETLLKLTMMKISSEKEITDFALEEAVRLTSSKGGYLHFFNEDEQTIQLYSWSKDVLKTCTAAKDEHYPLDKAGVWADSVRFKRPVIHNDYQNLTGKKGYPEGHFHLARHLGVPIFDNERIVGVMGVGNKEEPYNEIDAIQINLFMNSMWSILKQKRTEQEREKLILELREALSKVKTLSGMLPICASCKKIRDDKGYWNQIEVYIRDHSEAEFSHGLCPVCAKKYMEEIDELKRDDK